MFLELPEEQKLNIDDFMANKTAMNKKTFKERIKEFTWENKTYILREAVPYNII